MSLMCFMTLKLYSDWQSVALFVWINRGGLIDQFITGDWFLYTNCIPPSILLSAVRRPQISVRVIEKTNGVDSNE